MDRRLILLLLSTALAVVLGFFTLTPEQSLQAVIYGGYWATLAIFLLFAWSLYKTARDSWPVDLALKKRPRWPAALVLVCGVLLLVHESYGFKILMDEVMLLGTSMSLHFEKTALVPMRGHDIQGAFQLMAGELDKRPLFQPFLVSLLHDFTGYRPENVFVLNTGLTFLLLALAYVAGCRIGGRPAGASLVLLLTSLPLLAQNATGGGFEMLNLVMMLGTLLLGMRYLERRDGNSLEALCLSGILLAQTRYESVLYLLPVGVTVLWVWWRERHPNVTWLVAVAPLLMLPYALHNKVFSARTSSWEMGSQPGYDQPFSFAYIPDNLAHGLNFFFDYTGEQSNSLLLSVLGFIALPFFVLWVVKALRTLPVLSPPKAGLALFALGLGAHALLLMCYFWGRFDDPVIRRLSLPLNLTLGLAAVTVAAELSPGGKIWRRMGWVIGAGFFAYSLPTMARHDYSLDYYVGREMDWRREFIAAHPEKDYLFIDDNSIIWLTHQVSSTTVQYALKEKGKILFNMRNRVFSSIYVFQRLAVDPTTGVTTIMDQNDMAPDFELETVWERRFTPLTVSRISRVVSVREDLPEQPAPPPPRIEELSPAEREKARKAYLDNFINRLP